MMREMMREIEITGEIERIKKMNEGEDSSTCNSQIHMVLQAS